MRRLLAALWITPVVVGGLLLAWAVIVSLLPWNFAYWSELRQGNTLVKNIESFKTKNARLPNPDNVEEVLALGFELRVDYYPQYRITSTNNYELEYYIGFDGPQIIYSSRDKQWRCELCD